MAPLPFAETCLFFRVAGNTPFLKFVGSFFTMIYVDKKNKVRVIALVVVYATIFGVRAAFRLICGDQSNNALGTLAGTSVKLKLSAIESTQRCQCQSLSQTVSVSVTVNTSSSVFGAATDSAAY